ncbi:hypothetical protein HMPREF0043_00611 [Actinobaculum sp. oral taxon 183 str. F0552]|nr:hypothetical protein HMPREF0043_00611 [Actinobaculum sp. oral taxon 183 str. F0552]
MISRESPLHMCSVNANRELRVRWFSRAYRNRSWNSYVYSTSEYAFHSQLRENV